MKIFIILLFLSYPSLGREEGQIEITTESGIEVFQKEKYYLLKDNVEIISDKFKLNANEVKAFFEKDLYDIIKMDSKGNVKLLSTEGISAKGEQIIFALKSNDIVILGNNSSLINNGINMYANKSIKINDESGNFELNGKNSELKTDNIYIQGDLITGIYTIINGIKEIEYLNVISENKSNIKTNKINMFAKKANYKKIDNIIELVDNVKIIRDTEIVTGDYAKINTLDESYKVQSNKSKKVKVLIDNKNE